MTPPFLQDAARFTLILHAVVGMAAVGAATHLATYSIGLWRGKEPWRWHVRLFGLIVPILFLSQFAIGLLLYPVYRVTVRVPYLDVKAPLVSALFDIKEHCAALAVPLLIVASLLARRPAAKDVRRIGALLAVVGAALVWLVALLGLYVTSYRAVGAAP